MKKIFFLLTTFFYLTCSGQQEEFLLTVSPVIDRSDAINNTIMDKLEDFLSTKNSSLSENKLWLPSDFQKYVYPFLDIYRIESSRHGEDFFRPTLMEIIKTENQGQRIVKIAFIGHHEETKENQIKSIFNLVANIKENEVQFSRYLDFATRHWQTINRGSLTYKISPNKSINEQEISDQLQDIGDLCTFFNSDPIPITYFSCMHPKELFEIRGFDYNPGMYMDKAGGFADFGNIIFSGNNAEHYTHEIVHIYTNSLFPRINKFIDEGLATYIAGSGKMDYAWHREKFGKFLQETPDYNFTEHTDPFERLYFEEETSVPYLTAALILERTMRIHGKEKLLEMLRSERELWEILNSVGITKENINVELRKELQLPLTSYLQKGR